MEATGGHQQFYDKFSMRRHAINVLRYLFKNPIHRETFQKDAVSVALATFLFPSTALINLPV